jgi:hypothetical protein
LLAFSTVPPLICLSDKERVLVRDALNLLVDERGGDEFLYRRGGSRTVVSSGTMSKIFRVPCRLTVGPEYFPELFGRHLNRHFFFFLSGSDASSRWFRNGDVSCGVGCSKLSQLSLFSFFFKISAAASSSTF